MPSDHAAVEGLRGYAGAHIAVEEIGRGVPDHPVSRHARRRPASCGAAEFTRRLDTAWRRTSYSALTATAGHGPGVASEPEEPGVEDETPIELDGPGDGASARRHGAAASSAPSGTAPSGAPLSGPAAVPSPMGELPVGAGFGTLVHAVFEGADLSAPDLLGELTGHATEQLARHPTAGVDAGRARRGAAARGRARRSVRWPAGCGSPTSLPRDRLAELDFELPLAGGDSPRPPGAARRARPRSCAATSRRATRCVGYPDALAGLPEQQLRGYLTGSIDAVLRLPGRAVRGGRLQDQLARAGHPGGP